MTAPKTESSKPMVISCGRKKKEEGRKKDG